MPDTLLPDLPPTLEQFVREHYPDEVSARRALQAPWPGLGFCSAYEDRDLWRGGLLDSRKQKQERRRTYEQRLTQNTKMFTRDRPFFPALGTEGTLCSPYPDLSDPDYWVFVGLWGSEQDARRELEKPMPILGGQNSLQVLAGARRRGFWRRLTHAPDPRQSVLQVHEQVLNGIYT